MFRCNGGNGQPLDIIDDWVYYEPCCCDLVSPNSLDNEWEAEIEGGDRTIS